MNDKSWHQRLFGGFRRTSDRLSENLTGIFAKAALDEPTLDEIEEALIMSDLGPAMATRIRDRQADGRLKTELPHKYLRALVAEEINKAQEHETNPLEGEACPSPPGI